MWSSISSYLYDESAGTGDGGESNSAQYNRVPPKPKARTVASILKDNRRDRRTTSAEAISGRDGRVDSLQSSLHSTSSSTISKSKRHANKPSASDNTTIIRGIIVGEEQCGKTCLIRRLRGEDPFKFRGRGQPENVHSGRSGRERRNLMALIPWKLPADSLFQTHHTDDSEELVQLYMSEGKSFRHSNKERSFKKQWMSVLQTHRGKECNFIVWMIDPRMNDVTGFIQEGLEILFPCVVRDNNKNEEEERSQNANQPLIQYLCILLNFRDITPSQQDEDQKSLVDQVQSTVTKLMGSQSKNSQKDNQRPTTDTIPAPTVIVYESSMKNCYGLQNLHSFITLPYLSHRERELRRRAEHARKLHVQWEKGLVESKVVEYGEFEERSRLGEKKRQPANKKSLERQKLEEEKERLQQRLKRQNEMLRSKIEKQDAIEKDAVSHSVSQSREVAAATPPRTPLSNRSDQGVTPELSPTPTNDEMGQRKLFDNKSRQSQPSSTAESPAPASSIVTHNNTLDSFFSDDEEDDDLVETDDANSIGNYSSDSSNDGDFFIDVTGTRCHHANAAPTSQRNKIEIKRKETFAQATDPQVEGGVFEGESSAHPASNEGSDSKKSTDVAVIAEMPTEHQSSLKLNDQGETDVNQCETSQSSATDNGREEKELDGVLDSKKSTDVSVIAEMPTEHQSGLKLDDRGETDDKQCETSQSSATDKGMVEKELDGVPVDGLSSTDSQGTVDGAKVDAKLAPDTLEPAMRLLTIPKEDTQSDTVPVRNALKANTSTANDPDDPDAKTLTEEADTNEKVITEKNRLAVAAGDESNSDSQCDPKKSLDDDKSAVNNPHDPDTNTLTIEADTNEMMVPEKNRFRKNSEEPGVAVAVKEDSNSDGAVSECDPKKSFDDDNHDGDLSVISNPKSGHVDSRVERNLSQKSDHIKKNSQQYLVLDSDDDWTDPRADENTHDRKEDNNGESDDNGEELTIRSSALDGHQSRGKVSSMLVQHKRIASISNAPAKSAPISSLAMAAIEAAKRDAEQMIVQSQSDALLTAKEKKAKKKDKKKKKKKGKRQKDSEAV